MSLAFLTLGLLCARPARAQNNTGGYWNVTDQVGNALSTNPSGGYDLRGPLTGTPTLTGAYQDMLTASQQPNPTVGYAFAPNPASYQGWLFGSGATPPGGDPYNPYAVWITVTARNYANTGYGGQTGWLGPPLNEAINGTVTAKTGGTLWAVFQWSDPYSPSYYAYMHTTPPTPPDHINILLKTTVSASADPQSSGLSSSATATDSTFGETASAPGGVPTGDGPAPAAGRSGPEYA